MAIPHRHHILIVTGPAGCGKSTIAKYLSDRYGFEYIEGDEVWHLHNLTMVVKLTDTVPPKSQH